MNDSINENIPDKEGIEFINNNVFKDDQRYFKPVAQSRLRKSLN